MDEHEKGFAFRPYVKEVVKKNIKTKTKKWKKASSKRAIEHSKIRHTHMHIQIYTHANRTQKHTVSPETDRTVGRASSNTQVFQIVIPIHNDNDDDDDHYTSFIVCTHNIRISL